MTFAEDLDAELAKSKSKAEQKRELDEAIAATERAGYVVHKPQPPAPVLDVDISRLKGKPFRVGIVSDTHSGSKFQQLTYLHEHIAYMKKRKVQAILHCGDVTDGSIQMHPGFAYETFLQGADAQAAYVVEHFPNVGIPWFFIGGNHDASHWKSGGVDVVKAICGARDDFTYLSPDDIPSLGEKVAARHSVGYVRFGDVEIQMCHPHLGSTRQRSYRMELWVENLPRPRPNLVAMGNMHKCLCMDTQNVFGLILPSFQAQTGWMASKSLSSYVGSCIVEFGGTTKGLSPSITVEWLIEREPRVNDW